MIFIIFSNLTGVENCFYISSNKSQHNRYLSLSLSPFFLLSQEYSQVTTYLFYANLKKSCNARTYATQIIQSEFTDNTE